jgi:hypothetical protein
MCWAGALALMFGDAISGRRLLLGSLAYARCAHDDGIRGEAALRLGLLTNSQRDYAARVNSSRRAWLLAVAVTLQSRSLGASTSSDWP